MPIFGAIEAGGTKFVCAAGTAAPVLTPLSLLTASRLTTRTTPGTCVVVISTCWLIWMVVTTPISVTIPLLTWKCTAGDQAPAG